MTFLGDEGRDLLAVLQILRGDLIFLGPRSSAADFYYGPIYFYLITPFLWLFQYDPVGPAVFVALVGIATVYLVYRTGREFFHSEAVGLFAAALYTVSPLVIAYSRSSWNPNPLPFVSLLSLFFTYKAVETNKWKYFLFVGFLLGIAIQLQYLALFLIAIVGIFTLLGSLISEHKKRIVGILRAYGLMIVGFLVGWFPFLAFEVKNGFPNLRTISSFVLRGDGKSIYPDGFGFWENISYTFFKLFGRLVGRFPPPEQVNVNEDMNLKIWQVGVYILAAISIAALVWFWKRHKESQQRNLTVLLFSLWLVVGCFLFGFYKKEIFDYYLGFMFPLPFLLVGNMLGTLWNVKAVKLESMKVGKIAALVFFAALFLFNLDGNPFKYVPNRQKDQVRKISEFVLSQTEGKPYNFALLTLGNSDHAYRYFFEINKRSPVEIKNPDVDPERNSVTDQLLIVCEDPVCQPLGASLWEVAGFGRAEIAGEWNVSVVKVYRLVRFKE